jgi:hypothetical protein
MRSDTGAVHAQRRKRFAALALHLALPILCLLFCDVPPFGWQHIANGQPAVSVTINREHEYNVKAVHIYSFGRYVSWPETAFASPDSDFDIGVLGDSPFLGTLQQIAELKMIQNRKIRVHVLDSLDECSGCQVLVLPATVSPELQASAIREFKNRPVLLIGETEGFAASGGDIGFFIDDDRVRFQINAAAAKEKGLTIDAKLLSLGVLVHPQAVNHSAYDTTAVRASVTSAKGTGKR